MFCKCQGALDGWENQSTIFEESNSKIDLTKMAQRDTTITRKHSFNARISAWMIESTTTCFEKWRRRFPMDALNSTLVGCTYEGSISVDFNRTNWGRAPSNVVMGEIYWGGDVMLLNIYKCLQREVWHPQELFSPISRSDNEISQGMDFVENLLMKNNTIPNIPNSPCNGVEGKTPSQNTQRSQRWWEDTL